MVAKIEERKIKFESVDVPSQYTPMVKDNETGENIDVLQLMIKIANDVNEIKKGFIGSK